MGFSLCTEEEALGYKKIYTYDGAPQGKRRFLDYEDFQIRDQSQLKFYTWLSKSQTIVDENKQERKILITKYNADKNRNAYILDAIPEEKRDYYSCYIPQKTIEKLREFANKVSTIALPTGTLFIGQGESNFTYAGYKTKHYELLPYGKQNINSCKMDATLGDLRRGLNQYQKDYKLLLENGIRLQNCEINLTDEPSNLVWIPLYYIDKYYNGDISEDHMRILEARIREAIYEIYMDGLMDANSSQLTSKAIDTVLDNNNKEDENMPLQKHIAKTRTKILQDYYRF